MQKKEFETITGLYVSDEAYKHIEALYMDYAGDKNDFGRDFLANKDLLQEKASEALDGTLLKERKENSEELLRLQKDITRKETDIKFLLESLDKEREWRPYADYEEGCLQFTGQDYLELKTCVDEQGFTAAMTEEEAAGYLAEEFGFDRGKIQIQNRKPVYEINRHGQLRQVGTVERKPLKYASDWNYFRFAVEGYTYVAVNGALHIVES